MPPILNVYSLPQLVEPREMAGGTVVVIDVLRASTTIVYALEAGATEVIPCSELDAAREMVRRLPASEALLGGERDGLPPEGFDLGNSPEHYTADRVGGKKVVFTTTNGTRAIGRARRARRILLGAFVNAAAVVERLLTEDHIHLLCAGTRGELSRDDVLVAGMLVERLERQSGRVYQQNAQAITARETWLHAFALPQAIGGEPLEPECLAARLRETEGGRDLVALGLQDDILAAAQIDRFLGVPELDLDDQRIRLT